MASKESRAPGAPRRKRFRMTLIEVLVVACLAATAAGIINQVLHWRDTVEALARTTPVDWVIAILLFTGYRWLDKHIGSGGMISYA